MRVALQIPSPFLNLTSVIKPLLDGVICAFHFDSNPDPIAVQRLAATTGLEREMILHRLQSPKTPILGSRRLLDPYRSFVKWNPADDLCAAFRIRRVTRAAPGDSDAFSLRGSLVEIEPVAAS